MRVAKSGATAGSTAVSRAFLGGFAVAGLLAAGLPAAAQAPAGNGQDKMTAEPKAEDRRGVQPAAARAVLRNAKGEDIGLATLRTAHRGILIRIEARGLPPGPLGMHFHAVGRCEPPFESAGVHFNPGSRAHGLTARRGAHAGDMPNLIVPASGEVSVEIVNPAVSLRTGPRNTLFDADGTALVIHAGPDDHHTDPAGNSGARIACGVVERAE